MAENLSLREVRRRVSSPALIVADPFAILKSLCAFVSDPQTEQRAHELVLRALENRRAFGHTATVLDGLIRQIGLFPYLEREGLGVADAIAYEFHRPLNMEAERLVFHRAQAQVYDHLMDGENVILSAPTSFGKSLIIDAIIASGRYKNIAVIVPTIALIDETRRRLSRFSGQFKIITHGSQRRADRNLLIMTQERILELDRLEPLDFFVIDEFYKLQPRPEDVERSMLLNEAFYKLHKTGARFYMLGPNIRALAGDLPRRLDVRFIKTDYKTVASEVHTLKPSKDNLPALVRLCGTLSEPTLIYCSSPSRVRAVAEALLGSEALGRQKGLEEAVTWIGEQYHHDWMFPRALSQGVGMHHGRLPRALAQFVVRAFNEEKVRFLACTSTLIEGVNTKAKNVIILDNTVARRKFDFFTYNNILGRSGRMSQHFVGHVYVFQEPPAEDLPFIDIPAVSQTSSAPESLLIQIDQSDLSPSARERVSTLSAQTELDMETLRSCKGMDPNSLIELARFVRENANEYWPQLHWRGFPNWGQLQSVCNLIWTFLVKSNRRRSGVSSGSQLAFKVARFQREKSVSGLVKAEVRDQPDKPADEVVEETTDWLRTWAGFEFPRYLRSVDSVQRAVFTRLRLRPGNFATFASVVEIGFLTPRLWHWMSMVSPSKWRKSCRIPFAPTAT